MISRLTAKQEINEVRSGSQLVGIPDRRVPKDPKADLKSCLMRTYCLYEVIGTLNVYGAVERNHGVALKICLLQVLQYFFATGF